MKKIKYCKNCGHEIIFKTKDCPKCNELLEETLNDNKDTSVRTGVWAILLGFIPLLGWIIGANGLKKANLYNNKKGKTLNIIGIVIGTASFLFNLSVVL